MNVPQRIHLNCVRDSIDIATIITAQVMDLNNFKLKYIVSYHCTLYELINILYRCISCLLKRKLQNPRYRLPQPKSMKHCFNIYQCTWCLYNSCGLSKSRQCYFRITFLIQFIIFSVEYLVSLMFSSNHVILFFRLCEIVMLCLMI